VHPRNSHVTCSFLSCAVSNFAHLNSADFGLGQANMLFCAACTHPGSVTVTAVRTACCILSSNLSACVNEHLETHPPTLHPHPDIAVDLLHDHVAHDWAQLEPQASCAATPINTTRNLRLATRVRAECAPGHHEQMVACGRGCAVHDQDMWRHVIDKLDYGPCASAAIALVLHAVCAHLYPPQVQVRD
jgi:hypothetical protein